MKPYIIGSAALAATSFFLLGSSNVIGIHLGHSIYLVTAALCLNGIGIGGEQGPDSIRKKIWPEEVIKTAYCILP